MSALPIFDGHNDVLTRRDYARFVEGRPAGHLDLPRMRAGGIRGGIFAVFTPSRRERKKPLPRSDGVLEFELASRVSQPHAAAAASAAAGRLMALERAGHIRLGREIADIDAALSDDGPPVAVCRDPRLLNARVLPWNHSGSTRIGSRVSSKMRSRGAEL